MTTGWKPELMLSPNYKLFLPGSLLTLPEIIALAVQLFPEPPTVPELEGSRLPSGE